jgi:hypothetical protein
LIKFQPKYYNKITTVTFTTTIIPFTKQILEFLLSIKKLITATIKIAGKFIMPPQL